ncbi:MAG: hypothetical protein HC906_18595 [Bacteroidales bacterium]|nr:hypothetical protein [Bacteroidales bacterium]
MNKIPAILFLILIMGCEKNNQNGDNGIKYDFKVIRSLKNGEYSDSTIFYYSSDKKLIAFLDCSSEQLSKVSYETDSIIFSCEDPLNIFNSSEIYYLSDGFRIDSVSIQNLGVFQMSYTFSYKNNKLVSSERRNSLPELKYYYLYEGDVHVKDSIVVIPFIDSHYKVISYEYFDTLKPDFMISDCGLFEYPALSDFLIKETITHDYYGGNIDTIQRQFTYTINEKKMEVQMTENGSDVVTTSYFLF